MGVSAENEPAAVMLSLPLLVIIGVKVPADAGPMIVTMLPKLVAEKPFKVILVAILKASMLLVLLPVEVADINWMPFTLMLLTVVLLDPLTVRVVVGGMRW